MKSIFVTGAASGIGKATAILFASRGYRVGCYDIDAEGARAVAETIGATSKDVRPSYGRLDVTNGESWTAALDDFGGELDVLFNCAGILRMGRFEDISPEECRKQLDVNVMGVVLGIQRALPRLERRAKEMGSACIVTMSSASAIYGQPELAVYSASKFAVRALTEALDVELRSKNIRVCDVMPSYVDTPMVRNEPHRPATMKRLGIKLTADDVAQEIWRAVHGRGLHYIPQTQVAVLARLGGIAPSMSRAVMARLAKT
jgi:NAD(P)-dependent dehydrogenase (short-subunit alcohol dehydrogenase family)